jgi:hypothetical protein
MIRWKSGTSRLSMPEVLAFLQAILATHPEAKPQLKPAR